eukprot:5410455-Ditylum_brightwellii.AAC.1
MVCGCTHHCAIKKIELKVSLRDKHKIHSRYISILVPFLGANLVIPQGKSPREPMEKGRWLGFVENLGDEMTYHIHIDGRNPQDLVRLIIMTRRMNTGTD